MNCVVYSLCAQVLSAPTVEPRVLVADSAQTVVISCHEHNINETKRKEPKMKRNISAINVDHTITDNQ